MVVIQIQILLPVFTVGGEIHDLRLAVKAVELIGFNVVAQISLHGKGFPYESILRLAVDFPVILPEPPPQRLHGIFQIGLGLVFHQDVVVITLNRKTLGQGILDRSQVTRVIERAGKQFRQKTAFPLLIQILTHSVFINALGNRRIVIVSTKLQILQLFIEILRIF